VPQSDGDEKGGEKRKSMGIAEQEHTNKHANKKRRGEGTFKLNCLGMHRLRWQRRRRKEKLFLANGHSAQGARKTTTTKKSTSEYGAPAAVTVTH
jgi:hypothetical protein